VDSAQVECRYTPAALKALRSFPVAAENVELIVKSENVAFRVSVRGAKTDYVLRLHRPGYNSIGEHADLTRSEQKLLLRGMAIIGWLYQRPEHLGPGFFEELKNWVIGECDANES